MKTVLFLIEDGPYRCDHRVRREAASLRSQGLRVLVVAPVENGGPLEETLDGGVEVFGFRRSANGRGLGGLLGEYGSSLLKMGARVAQLHASRGFDVIHASNPPDLLWLVAAPYVALGKSFVFDMHDPVPEIFEERFRDSPARVLMPIVKLAERVSVGLAARVVVANGGLRKIAIERCGKAPELVSVVGNGPDLQRFGAVTPSKKVRGLGDKVVGYLGNMNPQDGLDHFVEMMRIIRQERGREDVGFLLVGTGSSFEETQASIERLGMNENTWMTGRLEAEAFLPLLGGVDLCVQPDPPTDLNHLLTMTKTMEYMALGKPVVAYPLWETRRVFEGVCQLAPNETPGGLADAVLDLIDDTQALSELGLRGRALVESRLCWAHRESTLLGVYRDLLPGSIQEPSVEADCTSA